MTDIPSKAQQPEAELFAELIAKKSDEEKADFINAVCGHDLEIKARMEKLLRAYDKGCFLEPLDRETETATDFKNEGWVSSVIGPYRLLRQLGEGGMGLVYLAEQKEPVKRKVALKIIRPGMDSRQIIARFELERQALAMMDHPNIARVLDGGVTNTGRPFFAMEWVRGTPITKYCDEHHLTPRERLELMFPVCEAVQHAHQKGIVHRDLKPSNILVAVQDGRAIPKVIDFGISKALSESLANRTRVTKLDQIVGTLEYMSPEQAEPSQFDIDTRSDIYSLGVLLYELLTGSTPFESQRLRSAAYHEMLRIIREVDPPRPSNRLSSSDALPSIAANRHADPRKLMQSIRGELDWIAMKALAKDRSRRYQTARELVSDLRHYLNGEPVTAIPPSTLYYLRKFFVRHKATLATAAIIASIILGAAVVSYLRISSALSQEVVHRRVAQEALTQKDAALNSAIVAYELADKRRRELAIERDRARRNLYLAHMRSAAVDWEIASISTMRSQLDIHGPGSASDHLRGWEWYYLTSLCQKSFRILTGHKGPSTCVAWNPIGDQVASSGTDGTIRIWDISTGGVVAILAGHNGPVFKVDWSSDGKRLASSGSDATIRVWESKGWKEVKCITGIPGQKTPLAWSPGGKYLAASGAKHTYVWDVSTWEDVFTGTGWASAIAWCPDGSKLAASNVSGPLRVWEIATKREVFGRVGGENGVYSVEWSPSGERLALSNRYRYIEIFGLKDAEGSRVRIEGHGASINDLSWNEAGLLASASHDGTVIIWDPATERELVQLRGHEGWVHSVAWSPDSQLIATASEDGTVRIWEPRAQESKNFQGRHRVAWHPDGSRLATATNDHRVVVLDAENGTELLKLEGSFDGIVSAIEWSPEGDRVSAAGRGIVQIWDTESGTLLQRFRSDVWETRCVGWSPDGDVLATGGYDRLVKLWNSQTGEPLLRLGRHSGNIGSVQWTSDGKCLASSSWDQTIKVWDVANRQELQRFRQDLNWRADADSGIAADSQRSIVWSKDDQRMYVGNVHGVIAAVDVKTGNREWEVLAHPSVVRSLSLSPDGRRLASGGRDDFVRVWDTATGQSLLSLRGDGENSVAWSPDGRQLASCGRSVFVWDASPAYRTED